ncbi:MAG: 5-methylthioribose kinase [Verrucomicrobiales bacterium]|jgi:5-methylthioribose kinase
MHPGVFFLDAAEPDALASLLRDAAILSPDVNISKVEKAGDGNMNCTLRVRTSEEQTFIVKQARPWVEKYPQFTAPWDRALREIEFYRLAGRDDLLRSALPKILHSDQANRLLVLEDLGTAGDCSDCYSGNAMHNAEIVSLAQFLSRLHRQFQGDPAIVALHNRDMRALNHAHIFDIPFVADNGLDLDGVLPGLATAARSVKADSRLVEQIRQLGESVYLSDAEDFSDRACLLHGDYFPGSFLRSARGLRVIDPEFCFGGRSEFDSGVFVAHLLLGQQAPALIACFLGEYDPPDHYCDKTMLQIAGVEILRRLLGYAQLPLAATLEQRKSMMDLARALVLEPDRALLLG